VAGSDAGGQGGAPADAGAGAASVVILLMLLGLGSLPIGLAWRRGWRPHRGW